VDWLRARPMMHAEGHWAMTHAGLLPVWSVSKALALAGEVEAALAGNGYRDFLANMYGSKPERWDDSLTGWDRLRVIVNAMTRLRYCTADGAMEFHTTSGDAPAGFQAWYRLWKEPDSIVFGHWSTLGLMLSERVVGIDTGCVWG